VKVEVALCASCGDLVVILRASPKQPPAKAQCVFVCGAVSAARRGCVTPGTCTPYQRFAVVRVYAEHVARLRQHGRVVARQARQRGQRVRAHGLAGAARRGRQQRARERRRRKAARPCRGLRGDVADRVADVPLRARARPSDVPNPGPPRVVSALCAAARSACPAVRLSPARERARPGSQHRARRSASAAPQRVAAGFPTMCASGKTMHARGWHLDSVLAHLQRVRHGRQRVKADLPGCGGLLRGGAQLLAIGLQPCQPQQGASAYGGARVAARRARGQGGAPAAAWRCRTAVRPAWPPRAAAPCPPHRAARPPARPPRLFWHSAKVSAADGVRVL